MKHSRPFRSGRPNSRRLLVGAITVVIGLPAAAQTSSTAHGTPSPPRPFSANQLDASGRFAPASGPLQERDRVSVLGPPPKKWGGQLIAHSEGLGKGATFTLELPLDAQST